MDSDGLRKTCGGILHLVATNPGIKFSYENVSYDLSPYADYNQHEYE